MTVFGSQSCGMSCLQLALVDGIAVGSAIGHVVDGGAAGTGQRQVALGRAIVGDRVGCTATTGGHTGNGRVKLALVDRVGGIDPIGNMDQAAIEVRSEEHTSELQSLMRISYAVFCLKKKK